MNSILNGMAYILNYIGLFLWAVIILVLIMVIYYLWVEYFMGND
jgi:hypothetical protein